MKRLCTLALLCLLSLSVAKAQIQVELSFDQEQFLPGEELLAKVRIQNLSGQTLTLGLDNTWLAFTVEPLDRSVVHMKKPLDVQAEFQLPSAHRATKLVDLSESYELKKYGRYQVRARVRIDQWGGQTFESNSRVFDISTGVKLWETSFGVPSLEPNGRPEIRKYILSQANHVKDIHLYARITDQNEEYTYKMFSIGAMISFSRPEAQLDQWSNLHILYQKGAHSFLYTVVTPDGLMLSRQTWEYTDTRPKLVGVDGSISVRGGARRISASDLPPPDLLSETAPSPVAAPGGDNLVDGNAPKK